MLKAKIHSNTQLNIKKNVSFKTICIYITIICKINTFADSYYYFTFYLHYFIIFFT
jgi:hypothetical protein